MSKKNEDKQEKEAQGIDQDSYDLVGRIIASDMWHYTPGMGHMVYQVNIKNSRYDCMVMLKAVDATNDRWIAFVVGKTPDSTIRKTLQEMRTGVLKWKRDEFAG